MNVCLSYESFSLQQEAGPSGLNKYFQIADSPPRNGNNNQEEAGSSVNIDLTADNEASDAWYTPPETWYYKLGTNRPERPEPENNTFDPPVATSSSTKPREKKGNLIRDQLRLYLHASGCKLSDASTDKKVFKKTWLLFFSFIHQALALLLPDSKAVLCCRVIRSYLSMNIA